MAEWTRNDPRWQSLSPYQRAAAMALMEADRRNPDDARNAAGAMVNRAAKSKQDLGEHVSRRIYQPTIEPAQQRRLGSIINSPQHQELSGWVERRATGKEADPVNGATHFLAPPRVMLNLERQNPSKYKNWGPRGANWTGYDPSTGQYRGTVLADKSHHFLAPEGAHSAPGPSVAPPAEAQPQFAAVTAEQLGVDGRMIGAGPSVSPPMPQMATATPETNPQGQAFNPTPGRQTIPVTPGGDMTANLQDAYNRGNRNMMYINDGNPRVVARPGEPSWSPRDPKAAQFSGPKFANQFLVQNEGYKAARDPSAVPDQPPPMARGPANSPPEMYASNAPPMMAGSRYDDGTRETAHMQPMAPNKPAGDPIKEAGTTAPISPQPPAYGRDMPPMASTQIASAQPTGPSQVGPPPSPQAPASAQPVAPGPSSSMPDPMALGGPKPPEGLSAKTRNAGGVAPETGKAATSQPSPTATGGLEGMFQNFQKMISGGMGRTAPNSTPQWSMDASNPGVKWGNGDFSRFGGGY